VAVSEPILASVQPVLRAEIRAVIVILSWASLCKPILVNAAFWSYFWLTFGHWKVERGQRAGISNRRETIVSPSVSRSRLNPEKLPLFSPLRSELRATYLVRVVCPGLDGVCLVSPFFRVQTVVLAYMRYLVDVCGRLGWLSPVPPRYQEAYWDGPGAVLGGNNAGGVATGLRIPAYAVGGAFCTWLRVMVRGGELIPDPVLSVVIGYQSAADR